MTGALGGVALARAALEYFEAQHAAAPSRWAEERVHVALRSLAAAEKHAGATA